MQSTPTPYPSPQGGGGRRRLRIPRPLAGRGKGWGCLCIHRNLFQRFRFREHLGREDMRDVVRVDGDHGDRLFAGQRAEYRKHLGARQAVAGGADRLDLDQVAAPGAVAKFLVDDEFGLAPLHRLDAERPIRQRAKDAEHRVVALLEYLHHPAGVGGAGRSVGGEGLGQNAVADARSLPAIAATRNADRHHRWRAVAVVIARMRQKHAVLVAAENVEHRDMGQGAGARQPLALLRQQALVLQIAQ